MRERPAAEVRLTRHEGCRSCPTRLDLGANGVEQVLGEAAAPVGQHLSAGVQHHRAAPDRGGDLARDLFQAAALQDEPLEALVDRDAAGEHVVLLVDQPAEGRLGDRDEGRLVRNLEDRERGRPGLGEDRLRDLRVIEAGAESQAGNARVGKPADERPLLLGVLQRDAGGEQELAAREPGRGIEQLGDVDPANLSLGRPVPSRQNLEAELGGEALDREHQRPTRRDDSSSTGRRTSTISSNCSVSAISGGENWMTGSPRSSARQISPRR